MKVDQYNRVISQSDEIIERMFVDSNLDFIKLRVDPDVRDQHNQAVNANYSELSLLSSLEEIDIEPTEWHRKNCRRWNIPQEYAAFDIARFVLQECDTQAELQRAAEELIEFEKREMTGLLVYLKYLVDTMTENNVVWGVGRGSSVSSFVLYKIGVHHVNSLYYDLDYREFLR